MWVWPITALTCSHTVSHPAWEQNLFYYYSTSALSTQSGVTLNLDQDPGKELVNQEHVLILDPDPNKLCLGKQGF